MKPSKDLIALKEKLGLEKVKKHIFLCAGPKCCSEKEGQESWQALKNWFKSEEGKASGFFRSRAGCLRICREGPIALVYPDGTWYHHVTPEVCQRIIKEHLVGGKVVEENVFATTPLK